MGNIGNIYLSVSGNGRFIESISDTLSIDTGNSRIGIGTASCQALLQVGSTGGGNHKIYTTNLSDYDLNFHEKNHFLKQRF